MEMIDLDDVSKNIKKSVPFNFYQYYVYKYICIIFVNLSLRQQMIYTIEILYIYDHMYKSTLYI